MECKRFYGYHPKTHRPGFPDAHVVCVIQQPQDVSAACLSPCFGKMVEHASYKPSRPPFLIIANCDRVYTVIHLPEEEEGAVWKASILYQKFFTCKTVPVLQEGVNE